MRWMIVMAGFLALLGCASRRAAAPASERQQQIGRLQDFASEKGFPETGNFRRGQPGMEAYFLCYYTGKWELPDSYDQLGYRESKTAGCGLDEARYDVYLHRVEAVAFEDTPITEALESAATERALMVAAHEEVHEDPQLHRLPHPVAEAASTLLGMLTAASFSIREGDSITATRLSGDAHLYLNKSLLVNKLHDMLKALYENHRRGRISRAEVAAAKRQLFAEAEWRCQELGRAHSINPCLPVANNAGLAFDHSYTREYPALYDLYTATGSDYERFLAELRALGLQNAKGTQATRSRIEQRAAALHARGGQAQ